LIFSIINKTWPFNYARENDKKAALKKNKVYSLEPDNTQPISWSFIIIIIIIFVIFLSIFIYISILMTKATIARQTLAVEAFKHGNKTAGLALLSPEIGGAITEIMHPAYMSSRPYNTTVIEQLPNNLPFNTPYINRGYNGMNNENLNTFFDNNYVNF
jgi:hypothetical protein